MDRRGFFLEIPEAYSSFLANPQHPVLMKIKIEKNAQTVNEVPDGSTLAACMLNEAQVAELGRSGDDREAAALFVGVWLNVSREEEQGLQDTTKEPLGRKSPRAALSSFPLSTSIMIISAPPHLVYPVFSVRKPGDGQSASPNILYTGLKDLNSKDGAIVGQRNGWAVMDDTFFFSTYRNDDSAAQVERRSAITSFMNDVWKSLRPTQGSDESEAVARLELSQRQGSDEHERVSRISATTIQFNMSLFREDPKRERLRSIMRMAEDLSRDSLTILHEHSDLRLWELMVLTPDERMEKRDLETAWKGFLVRTDGGKLSPDADLLMIQDQHGHLRVKYGHIHHNDSPPIPIRNVDIDRVQIMVESVREARVTFTHGRLYSYVFLFLNHSPVNGFGGEDMVSHAKQTLEDMVMVMGTRPLPPATKAIRSGPYGMLANMLRQLLLSIANGRRAFGDGLGEGLPTAAVSDFKEIWSIARDVSTIRSTLNSAKSCCYSFIEDKVFGEVDMLLRQFITAIEEAQGQEEQRSMGSDSAGGQSLMNTDQSTAQKVDWGSEYIEMIGSADEDDGVETTEQGQEAGPKFGCDSQEDERRSARSVSGNPVRSSGFKRKIHTHNVGKKNLRMKYPKSRTGQSAGESPEGSASGAQSASLPAALD